MANNYLDFSEVITCVTPEEEAWLERQLAPICVIDDVEYPVDAIPEALQERSPEWEGCRAYRDMDDQNDDYSNGAGFKWEFCDDDDKCSANEWGRYLWLHTEEWGDVDRLAHLVQKFLKEFRPKECWSLTYSTTCSKPRIGEFGGGALFVTAKDVVWNCAYQFVDDQRKAFRLRQSTRELIQRAVQLGIEAEDLDDLVLNAASSPASEINNSGVDGQIQWLVERLGLDEVERQITDLVDSQPRKEGSDEDTPDR